MDVNESLRALLHFERPEEVCLFEWGYWPDTIERWKREGMPSDDPWDDLDLTYYHRAPIHPRFFPEFEEKVLSETASTQVVRDERGIIKEVMKNSTSLPKFLKHPVSNLRDFEALKERLDPHDPGRFPDNWDQEVQTLKDRNSVLVMGRNEISFFGWHRDLLGVENLLMAYYEQPELIHAISQHHLYFLTEFYAKILKDVTFDFIFVWEDMSYRNGSLISPDLVREFMLPYYREFVGFFREFGDYKFLLDSDGDVSTLIPLFMEVGIDGMLPFEVAAGMDIRAIAQEYPDLIIAGGIDKREIGKGPAAIDRELETRLPPLFKRGGYLPSMDHHVPPEVSYDDFKYYVRRVRELYAEHGR